MLRLSPSLFLEERYLNRHGLISGATGSGKSVTLMRLAEECDKADIPVIMTDVKGDLSTMLETNGGENRYRRVFTKSNAPKPWRVTPSSLEARTVARMISANATMTNALESVFEEWHAIPSLETLISLVERDDKIPTATRGAIMRRLKALGQKTTVIGQDESHWIPSVIREGVTVLECTELYEEPRAYGGVMTYILERLFRELPECGDLDKPRLMVIIDEAHLLFNGLPVELFEGVERCVRLLRSRGVAVWFATQNPQDIDAPIAAQLATRIVHGMRIGNADAARKLARDLPRMADHSNIEPRDILSLAPGEAFATTLDRRGSMTPSVRTTIFKPQCPLDRPQAIPVGVPRPTPAPYVLPRPRPAYGMYGGGAIGLAAGWLVAAGDGPAVHVAVCVLTVFVGVLLGGLIDSLACRK